MCEDQHGKLCGEQFHNALKPEERAKFDVGDLPRGGDSYTVDATGGTENQPAGGSFKIIVDTEDWDNSVGLNNPGQSGDVNDPHYRDLYQLWARGRYFPIFYTRRKIESVVEKTFDLQPASGQRSHPERRALESCVWFIPVIRLKNGLAMHDQERMSNGNTLLVCSKDLVEGGDTLDKPKEKWPAHLNL